MRLDLRLARAGLLAGLAASGLAACGTGGTGAPADPESAPLGSCDPVVQERLDPSSALHLLPGAPEPTYLSDPPTSGPHLSGRPFAGVLDEAIDRPTQVLVLETGGVVIQHRDLSGDDLRALAALASDQVVVAPNPTLPAPVVATAWLARQTCGGVDLEALRQFVDGYVGRGPEGEER